MLNGMAVQAKTRRLVEWNSVLLGKLLKQILVQRKAKKSKWRASSDPEIEAALERAVASIGSGNAIDEVKDIISLPHFDQKTFSKNINPDSVEIPETVMAQVELLVGRIADLYQSNPFHNVSCGTLPDVSFSICHLCPHLTFSDSTTP